jgi:ATP-dependent RNA helicase DDX3X
MENKEKKSKKQNNKYVLLEKPMFFNSKLNKDKEQSSSEQINLKDINTNNSSKQIPEKINIDKKKENKKSELNYVKNNNDNNININKESKPTNEIKFRCFEVDPNETKWASRYGRPGYVKSSKNEEDEKYINEHLKNLEKKDEFDFNAMEKNTHIHIFLKNKEISDEYQQFSSSFKNIDFHPLLKKNLIKMKYNKMTPIQKAIIPYILQKNDCLGCAETGSGKTVAFLAPIISLLLKDGPPIEDKEYLKQNSKYSNSCSYPVCLVLVPTRELAEQIYIESRKLLYKTGIVVSKCYGGVPIDGQIRELRQGVDIVIGTPGRIIEFIDKKVLYLNLIEYLVIDESDRMLDMGFKPQLENIINDNKQMKQKEKRINLMFSATIPEEVEEISYEFMKENCYLISTNKNRGNKKEYNANENVEQLIYYVKEEEKIAKLHEILQTTEGNVLVFLEKKKSVDKLENFLLSRNYNAIGIHGDKIQSERQKAIKKFSSGEIPILVATDVASRGLDFPNVSYVFNFDMPKNIEDYIHRIGRTGRVGNKGKAISFYNENNKQIGQALVNELKKSGQKIPEFLEEFDYYNYNNYQFYNSDITPFDDNKEYNDENKDQELYKYNDKFDRYENKGYDKYYRNQYNYNNYRGRGYKNYNYNRGNYYKYKRNNEYNGNYHKGGDNWRK